MNKFDRAIQIFLECNNMSQNDFARYVRISPNTIIKYRKGIGEQRASIIRQIAIRTGIPYENLTDLPKPTRLQKIDQKRENKRLILV